ncbi:protein unc-80 homolog isoform X4 [Neocloeon triangulifer]|uniref:protein unc-80 homolog isoform X4 n=1 Tax=Neocloeon triangulifer TaxID=2078957 RepID=UPI00286F21A7|nr:protein unc-80 homolog isoform X4 [Neocloeon triangulifer]
MDRRESVDDSLTDQAVPIPIQIFLWRQTSPFIRPKLGKLHETTCLFCQNAPGHHELKEACKSFEKVLVQNIQFGLSPSLTEAIKAVPRWKLVQASFPHVMHCAAALLSNRRENTSLQSLSAAETKLLYTLHWIILDAAEECANDEMEKNVSRTQASTAHYLFSIPSITLFVYLFAPLCHLLKEHDLQSFRLENGIKLWQPLWEYKHPTAKCFAALCKPRPLSKGNASTQHSKSFGDVFTGTRRAASLESSDSPASGQSGTESAKDKGEDSPWLSSPKETVFPETIPEESSSTEEEHMVILKLPSLPDADGLNKEHSVYTAHPSLFQVKSVPKEVKQLKPHPKVPTESLLAPPGGIPSKQLIADLTAATFMDVAVLRCLFISQWCEEGVYWALQYLYHRLREINDETSTQFQPRRRSNSLPIPKIEVSIYQSPEMKKKESKVLVDYSDDSFTSKKQCLSDETPNMSRRSSEKVKKRTKIADLRAFVETKLLSKSEKTLEKIGQEDGKLDQEHASSLDTGDDNLVPRPCSALAKIGEPRFDNEAKFIKPASNLVKGKSMPSLSCLIDELASAGYISDLSHMKQMKLPQPPPSAIPHPIITVTEHTPTPSPDFTRRQEHGSIDSQLDALSLQGRQGAERKSSLTRSQTDSNITYSKEETLEAPGSAKYITKDGDIDYQVVVKAVHAASQKDGICTLRVCEVILNLTEMLMELGVLKTSTRHFEGLNVNSDPKTMTPAASASPMPSNSALAPAPAHSEEKPEEEQVSIAHTLLMNCVVKVLKQLGCPNGCSDSQRGPPADFLRSQGQSILSKLHRASHKQFTRFFRKFVQEQPIGELLDFFHAYTGYCVDPGSLLSPLNQKRSASKSPDMSSNQTGYANNFGASLGGAGGRGVEGQILSCVFKCLITRLVTCMKEIKTQEHLALYCDVRQFVLYIKEAHGGVFRRVVLSALIDAAVRPHKKEPEPQTTRVIRHVHGPAEDQEASTSSAAAAPSEPSCTIPDENRAASGRKFLFKKRSTSSTCASLLETELAEEPIKTQSPLSNVRRKHHILTPRHSERNLGVELPVPSPSVKGVQKGGKLSAWFKRDHSRTESTESHDGGDSPIDSGFIRQSSLGMYHYSKGAGRSSVGTHVGQTFQKARRKVEDQLIKIGLGKGKKKDGVMEETSGSHLSRKNSMELGDHRRESEFVVLKERKLIPVLPVYNGMLRFSFLLEICQPGTVPDAQLLAALLDLPNAPVVSKACLLLECCFFVHNCNKGQWPMWMRLNFPMFRPSVPSRGSTAAPSGLRRSHILQRYAGKMFYQWAEAIGARLEDMVHQDKQHVTNVVGMVTDETKQKELSLQDEEEDFLDESSIGLMGLQCPLALRMVACLLLLEITTFLRETYQALPKSSRLSNKDRPPAGWDKIYSKDANRRWSMALSSMGHSQTSAQSLQSIAGDKDNERKISFVLHEPDNESEGSSNTTVTAQGEEVAVEEKKRGSVVGTPAAPAPRVPPSRPYLLRRGTNAGTAGSFKRRSLKLRRNTKDASSKSENESTDSVSGNNASTVRRTDSIQSKRKVSSISDRSDTSDHGADGAGSGGEESPGVLSDEQPPESPSDSNDTDDGCCSKNMPWMKTVVQLANSYNFYCSHQGYCHPYCYRRHMRACNRLVKSVRKVYGEQFGITGDYKNPLIEKLGHHEKKDKQRGRKVSDQTSSQTSPIRRKDSLGRKDRIDLKFTRDSSRDIADQTDSERGREPTGPPHPRDAKDEPPILKYIKAHARSLFHSPLSVLLKGAVILHEESFIDILPVAWELLLEPSQEVAAAAASLFILAAVKAPAHASNVMQHCLQHSDVTTRIQAVLRFQVLWKSRFQVWPRMEEGAYLNFKVPPPGIEFTLPSPKIGIESLPVVDPPWMPQVKTKVEEVTISQESHRSLVTATKTRKKQQTELIKLALQAEEDKKRQERENFLITTIPITFQAAYEPSLHQHEDHDDDEEQQDTQARAHTVSTAHSLFPSCLCASVIQIIGLLDDAAVAPDGSAVYEVAYQVIWNCLVEDSALFLRYVLERVTREKQDLMFKILRHLIRFVPKLPQQAAFALYNYIIGYVMFYVRTPHEGGQELVGTALSILWMVVHSVHGIMFKDLKQILRKEQCDASILLTANVPSAKKIIVHGPQEQDVGGIPSQFPVQEDTQFVQILRESLDFFGIDEAKHKEFFLVDHKTHQIHNPNAYVRDFYFFKRSQYPQLQLVYMKPEEAYNALQKQAFILKFVEIGKVLLTWAILKNVDMVVQRVVFLHEELMKLPSFPRKALESELDLYKGGEMGKELLGLDMLHKFMWVRLIARMFEAMAGNFAYSGDIHLFLNVLNGSIILHSECGCILRYVTATYINAAFYFKNIFSTNGYLLIMPTLMQIYSNHQTNKLVTRTVEYTVKQFYLMHRKPFILQMFGAVSAILDTDDDSQFGDAHKVQPNCLFNLLLSLETPSPDPLNIGELVREEKPLKAIDFCYHDENEMVTVFDCISLCVMVVAYSADSVRGQQMLITLEAILPCYLQHIQLPSYKHNGKSEKDILLQLSVAINTLVNNCEGLSKNYTGPQKSSPDHKGSSQRNFRSGPYSPGFEFDEDSHSKYISDHSRTRPGNERDLEDSEVMRNEFRRPRDILLSMVADFLTKCSARLMELNKKTQQEGKPVELMDIKAHVRLSDIAHSLLKVSPYDPDTMGCRGLQRYMNEILPSTEWSNEAMRPALTAILRRLDKTFSKIYKKPSIRRHTDWDAAAGLLKGVYETMSKCPYIVHMQHVKTLMNTCQALIVGDAVSTGVVEGVSSATAALMSQVPPPHFCSIVVRLIALQILAIGETYSLEQVCGGNSVFPSHNKTETMLMNLLMPLCIRVGSGRKDMPRMRQADISFALTIVLHALHPPATKTSPVTAQNIKSASEMRAGSITFGSGRDSKRQTPIPMSLFKVAFLALKTMIACFETELVMDWPRIARTIQELGRRGDCSLLFWTFTDYVVTQRPPLYILLHPFIHMMLLKPGLTDAERHLQSLIKDKLGCTNLPPRKAKGAVLVELAHEMKELKEQMDDRRYDEGRKGTDHGDNIPPRPHRPSIIELFTGDLARHHHRQPADNSGTNLAPPQSILQREGSVRFSPSCESVVTPEIVADDQAANDGDEESTLTPPTPQPEHQQLLPPSGDEHFQDRTRLKASKLRFVPSVEFRHTSGETSTTPLSAGSPNDESSGEHSGRKPRLQRSKAQSRKTFRLRKSRKSKIEVSHIKVDPPAAVPAPMDLQQMTPPSSATLPPCSPALQRTKSKLCRELSYDDDNSISQTSSTSGYREAYTERYTLLNELPPVFPPPLASPDHPSSSSAPQGGESSQESLNSGEDMALLPERPTPRASLMALFEHHQDEDTLL